MEKTAAELEAEKKVTDDAALNVDGEETEGGEGGDGADADLDKKDYSKMSDEEITTDLKEKHPDATPDELFGLLAKSTKIIGYKNRAITSLKKPKPDAKTDEEIAADKKAEEEKTEAEKDDLDKPITKRDLVEQNNKNAIQALINTETTEVKDREAIMNAYDNDIIKSGDIAADFKKSLAIASADDIGEYRKTRSKATQDENDMTGVSGSGSYGNGEGGSNMGDAKKRAVAQNMKSAGYDQKVIDEEIAKL